MKNLLISLSLCVAAACATPGMIPMEPVVTRSIDRVLTRHDMYVNTDPTILEGDMLVYLLESQIVRFTVDGQDEVDAEFLLILLTPVMDRHDAFINGDPGLEQIERDVYLNSTARLRSLLSPQPAAEPVPAS